MSPPRTPVGVRLWAKVNGRDEPGDDCWEWMGLRNARGYGRIKVGRSSELVTHRVAWELTNGPIPDGLFVLHHCDNPPCVRPDHLFIGTTAENMADRDAKGRQARGQRQGRARLVESDVRYIRSSTESQRELGRRFAVDRTTIKAVVERSSWRHVP
ncbi:MAG: HNH endonuclease [Gemmatimonadetes bacterium]|nr:HNH endonuclease [Gemmatimonadota bacterium]